MDFENRSHHRNVKYTKDAQRDLDILDTQYPRFKKDALYITYEFLKEYAHEGKLVRDPLYVYITLRRGDTPAFEFYYTFDALEVRVHNVIPAPIEDDPPQ
jgi:hypothetical protein